MATEEPKKRRRDVGDDGISWDRTNKVYVGTISLGFGSDGKRDRRTVRAKTKTEVKNRLAELHDEMNAGIRTPATYTVELCVQDWLDSIERDPHTLATLRGQAKNWINPKIGAAKLKEFSATDADEFFEAIAKHLSKRTLVMIKSTLRRSIRRAQVHKLIGQNVVELIDLPSGKPGRPSRAMTQAQAGQVLKAASGKATRFVKVVKASNGRYGATHAATEQNELACGTKPHAKAAITDVSTELKETTCKSCRDQLGLDDTGDANVNTRLEALFVLSITLGLRPGELRKLTWNYVDLRRGVIHVWRSASKSGDTKTPHSKRSLELPKRAVDALAAHKKRQAKEREQADWHDNDLVFCHPNGDPYTGDALNWRFSKMTKRAGIGHWHPHEGRHTAVSIMSSNGVPIQDISGTVGHKSTHVTETVYRHVIVPKIHGGASVMDNVFGEPDEEEGRDIA